MKACYKLILWSMSMEYGYYGYYAVSQKLGMEFIFCMQEDIKVSTSCHYRFRWKWLDMSKAPKIENWEYFCN